MNDPIVKPDGMSPAMPVTIVTPVGKCPSTLRNWAESNGESASSVTCSMVGTRATLRAVQAKGSLRASMREVRRAIAADPADRLARSDRIWARIVAATALGPPRNVLLFESLPTEPDTAGWFAWCREHEVATFAPEVDGPALRVVARPTRPFVPSRVQRRSTRGCSTSSSCRGWPSPPTVAGSARAAATTTASCLGCAPGASRSGRRSPSSSSSDIPTEPHDVRLDIVVTDA